MELTSVDHAELYVGDAVLSAYFFCHALGFRMVAQAGPESGLQGRRSVLLKQGSTRLVVTSALTPEGPVAEYVHKHGDGVKDVAFCTPDAEAAFREAVRRGARPVQEPTVYEGASGRVVKAAIAGPGDLIHSFVQREPPSATFLPDVYLPLETPAGEPELFSGLDHVALALERGTLLEWVAFYRDVLGFEQTHQEDVRTEYSGMNSRVVQTAGGRICFPMQEPVSGSRRGQLEDFLASHGGSGVQHLAFLSPDITRAVDQMSRRGMKILDAPPGYYEALEARLGGSLGGFRRDALQERNILMDRDAWGHLLQAFTRTQHARRTLFFEVIQRQDARGFGGANIQALYEAKERESLRAQG